MCRAAHTNRFRIGVEGSRAAHVSHQDVGRRVVRVTTRPQRENVARETGAGRIVGEPAIFGVAGNETQDIGPARLAGRNPLRFRHQQRQLIGARRIEALVGADG